MMKMNIRAWLLAPWIFLFAVITASVIIAGAKYHIDLRLSKYSLQLFILAVLYCAYLNFKTITKAGIWISYSVPKSLKPNSWHWLIRVVAASLIALSFYKIGQISWIPLYWQGFVLPIVFSAALVFSLTYILSPILIWCAKTPLIRLSAILSCSFVLLFLPLSGIYMGEMILHAYEASLPKPFILEDNKSLFAEESVLTTNKDKNSKLVQNESSENKTNEASKSKEKTTDKIITDKINKADENIAQISLFEPKNENAKKFKTLVLSKAPCPEEAVNIQASLHERNSDEVVFWATRAVACANLKPIPALTKLVDIMLKHSNAKVRASAIMAMANFKTETVQRLGYLLVKQINEKQPPVVIEAASYVFSRLGSTEYNWTMRKLKILLSHLKLHKDIADIMVRVMNREDLILEYIVTSLNESQERTPIKLAAIEMICALPKKSLVELGTQVNTIVGLIDTGNEQDPAKLALDCLGSSGLNAIRAEIKTPKILNRVVAARVLSQMDIKNSKDVLDTVSICIYDSDEEIRKFCSTSLGRVGVMALPKIIDLMNASKDDDKKYGEIALNAIDDPSVKQDLLKIRANNSGWATTQKKLHLVRSIDTTLVRIEDLQSQLLKQQLEQQEGQFMPVKSSLKVETGKTTL